LLAAVEVLDSAAVAQALAVIGLLLPANLLVAARPQRLHWRLK
jgi:hypothetical protein